MFGGTISDCPIEDGCLEWVHRYLKDCVCSFMDEVSLALGLISVVSWGVAEIPQIITNFREGSTEGVSLTFLMTWVVGDIFNVAGCYLEPATLPTQFYMAVMYTFTTVILVAQTIYYEHIRKWYNRKIGYMEVEESPEEKQKVDVDTVKPVQPPGKPDDPKREQDGSPGSSPASVINVPLSRRTSLRASDYYYTSARSLAKSHTPGIGSYIGAGSHDRESLIMTGSSGTHGLLRSTVASSPQHTSVLRSESDQKGSLLRTAAASVLLVGSFGMTSTVLSGGINSISNGTSPTTQFSFTGRRLLQQISVSRSMHSFLFLRRSFLGEMKVEGPWGEVFGWCMAAIYMGGRLPQILLNIKRGTVEGLNPLMFIFALVGNATYVGSILVRSVKWEHVKPNLPWLVDAAVCVLLDTFILCQFIYYNLKVMDEGSDSGLEEQKETEKK